MKRTIGIVLLLFVVALPALAQWQQWRLSPDDQQRYDSYFARWQEYRQNNDRDQIRSMEKRMMDIYARYNVPVQTPFWRVASNARSIRNPWRGRLSSREQERFDSYFSRWQDARRSNNREQINSMEGRMQDLYRRNQIPSSTPYFLVASKSGDEDWDAWDRDRWRGRLSPEDQRRFDSYYGRWVDYRRVGDREQMTSMERRMQDVMQQYEIPQQVPFEQIASR